MSRAQHIACPQADPFGGSVRTLATKKRGHLGYDPVYGVLRFNASGNHVVGNIAVPTGSLRHPLIVIGNYTGALPSTLRLNGHSMVRDQDWLPSLRKDAQQVWITLRRHLSGSSNSFELSP